LLGVDLGEGRGHRRDVAAVAVQEVAPREAVAHQRLHHVAHHRDQGRGPQGEAAGKGQVMLRHADAQGGGDEGAGALGDAARHGLGADRVRPDESVGPVLLGGADRDDDAGGRAQVALDLLPGAELK
jgi:hypothetical protein